MKMMCPHCGVKGSAEDSLLRKNVKCPKCSGIFEVNAEVVDTIPVSDIELEQISESVDSMEPQDIDEDEVGGAFDDIFGEDAADDISQELDESEIDRLLTGRMDEVDEEQVVAALSDYHEDEEQGQWLGEEDDGEDETLTVIEDFPEEAVTVETEDEVEEETAALDFVDEDELDIDESSLIDSGKFDWDEVDDEDTEPASAATDDDDEILGFEDELLDEIESDRQEAGLSSDETDVELQEGLDVWEDEQEIDEDLFGEEEDDNTLLNDEVDEFELTVDEAEAELEEADGELEILTDKAEDDQLEILEDEQEDGQERQEDDPAASVQKCSACGEYVDQQAKYKLGTNVYCNRCVPRRDKDKDRHDDSDMSAAAAAVSAAAALTPAAAAVSGKFTISALIKDAYSYSKGVKGSIWGGVIIMYLVLIGMGVASVFLLPDAVGSGAPLIAVLVETGSQVITGVLSFIFAAGIVVIAVNKIGQKPFSWKMVFSGFKKFGPLLGLYVLQIIMLVIGFCLLVLPGIYLSVAYALAIPLVMVKGLSPWQALETSRKAIHTRWWTVFFSFIVMTIVMIVSMIPLGLGMIWTVPMFVVLIGVLYYHFFGDED